MFRKNEEIISFYSDSYKSTHFLERTMASVTPLVSLLKFKSLNARLLDTEFDTFMSRMWKIVGREEILKLLCTPFLKQSNDAPMVNEQEPNLLDAMTTMTSDIIQARDTNSNPRTKPNINNMPSCLVGTIASFLNQKNYIKFSRTNRKIYVTTVIRPHQCH